MQDLINYKGYSIFSYCTRVKENSDKFVVSITITDTDHKEDSGKPITLEHEYEDIEVALGYAAKEGMRIVDERLSDNPSASQINTDVNYKDM
jgi:hypothetical protein